MLHSRLHCRMKGHDFTSNPEAFMAVLISFLFIKRSHCPRTVVVTQSVGGGGQTCKSKILYRLKYSN